MALIRIKKEFTDVTKAEGKGISAQIVGDDFFKWQATINGDEASPYKGGVFFLAVEFPKNYPFSPPKIKFDTKIYHCNVNEKGEICLEELKEKWSPGLTISRILDIISGLMKVPNIDNPVNAEIASEYKTNKRKHDETAADWTRKYAQ
jgi:ubiquitin-conjugating enzyme E2 D/E